MHTGWQFALKHCPFWHGLFAHGLHGRAHGAIYIYIYIYIDIFIDKDIYKLENLCNLLVAGWVGAGWVSAHGVVTGWITSHGVVSAY